MLTDEDGKQDAKEDQEEGELHVVEPGLECKSQAETFMLPAG